MSIDEFDARAMYAAMDAQRAAHGLSWPGVARALWDQSAVLNERRGDHPSAPRPSPASRNAVTARAHALFILRWLGRVPEHVDCGGISRPSTLPSTSAAASAA